MSSKMDEKYLSSQGAVSSTSSLAPQTVVVTNAVPVIPSQKKIIEAYILAIPPLGLLGIHRFYLKQSAFGLLYFCTLGLFGIGWLFDMLRMPLLVKDANRRIAYPLERQKIRVVDAYQLWFPPCGLFGFHHFYLGRTCWGVLYMCTVGMFGIGWIIDGIRMKWLVEETNKKAEFRAPANQLDVGNAYVLGAFPISGMLGFHHYYMRRYGFGALYTCSLGLGGVGYLVDLLRMPVLVGDANRKMIEGDDGRKRLDDAYVCLFPFGFLGLHHFYLQRYGWFVLYLCTFGCFGIGWLVDFIRLPYLVKDYNKSKERTVLLQGAVAIPYTTPGSGDGTGTDNQAFSPSSQGGVSSTTLTILPAGCLIQMGVSQHPAGQVPPPTRGYQGQVPPPRPPPPAAGQVPPPYPGGYAPPAPVAGTSSWSTVGTPEGSMQYMGHEPPSYQEATASAPPSIQVDVKAAEMENSLNETTQRSQAPALPTKTDL